METSQDIKTQLSQNLNVPVDSLKWGRRGRGARKDNFLTYKGSARRLTARVARCVPDWPEAVQELGLSLEHNTIRGSVKSFAKLVDLTSVDTKKTEAKAVRRRQRRPTQTVRAKSSRGRWSDEAVLNATLEMAKSMTGIDDLQWQETPDGNRLVSTSKTDNEVAEAIRTLAAERGGNVGGPGVWAFGLIGVTPTGPVNNIRGLLLAAHGGNRLMGERVIITRAPGRPSTKRKTIFISMDDDSIKVAKNGTFTDDEMAKIARAVLRLPLC